MSKIFLDSNILIYLYSVDKPKKKATVENLLQQYESVIISTQVLFEFTHITHKKFKVDYLVIENALKEFYEAFTISLITYDTIQRAVKLLQCISILLLIA